MNEEPPAYRIMAWRYLKPKAKKLTGQQMQDQHAELSGMLGAPAQKMPEHMKDALRWAEEQRAKLNRSKT